MPVTIRLSRHGARKHPFYRIVVADSRTKRDGRVIEEIGTYNPKTEPSTISVASERAQYWLGVGAQPTEAVAAILKLTGDIGGNATLKHPEEKADKAAVFEKALKDLHTELPKAKRAPKPKVEEAPAEDVKADEPAVEEAPAEEAKTDEPAVEETAAEEVKTDEPAVEEAPAEEEAAADAESSEA